MDAPFDPDAQAYLAMVRNAARPPFETLSVEQARSFYRAGRDTVNLPQIAVGAVTDMAMPGRMGPIRLRHYLPDRRPRAEDGCILFFHGGGWVIGDLDTHDAICRHLVTHADLPVIAVDYRLAPEHPFPAAVEDALDAHVWVLENASLLGFRPDRLVLAGDSAGGCLALVCSLAAAQMGRPRPAAQLLYYPVTDLRGGTPSYQSVTGVPITAATMSWFAGHYLAEPSDAEDWRASPLIAPDVSGLPPTFLAIAGHDPLRDEGLALGQRICAAGGELTLRHLPGQVHGYLTVGRIIAEASRTLVASA
ncbi:MAG: alpha/beta hydrolase, partial [Novosphingobium sp.]